MKAIEIDNLVKVYGKDVKALKGVSLSVQQGDFYALLGPNGAGKSTTIGIICSLVNKTAGSVKIFGYDIDTHLVEAKRNLAWCHKSSTLISMRKLNKLWSIRRVIMVLSVSKPKPERKSTSPCSTFGKSAISQRKRCRGDETSSDDCACVDARTEIADP